MSPSRCFFVILSLTLCLTAFANDEEKVHKVHPVIHHPDVTISLDPIRAGNIVKACEHSFDKAFCHTVLKNNPKGNKSDMKELAFVALEAAAKEATNTASFIRGTIQTEQANDEIEDSYEEQSLEDCAEEYSSIVAMTQDAVDGLLMAPKGSNIVESQLQAAIDTAETCAQSIKKKKKGKSVRLASKNRNVQQLCLNALSVYNAYAGKS